MIKLSDYLEYLNNEVIQARKKADEQAVIVAKEYAKDPYLRYFRVPRFSMPSVKLNIPIKISELDSEVKYNFKLNEEHFIDEVNTRIAEANETKKLEIPAITKKTLEEPFFKKLVTKLEKKDNSYVKKIDDNFKKVSFDKVIGNSIKDTLKTKANPFNTQKDQQEIASILKDAIQTQYTPVSAKVNNIYFDPNTANETDKNKLLLTLNVELVEEGIRIHEVVDKDGNTIEEIIFE